MRSARVTPNTVATPNDYNALINDSSGAATLLAHQMYGTIALPTNPSNTQTLTLVINGTNVVITFVSSIGATAGNVLIGATAAATVANLIQLLLNPTISNSTQVAIGLNTSAAVTLVNCVNWSPTGTSIIASSFDSTLYAPATSFSASTTATSGSYTANTMKLYVEPGVVYVNGTEVYFGGGSTPAVTAPVSHPRIDVLTLDNTGTIAWTTGTESASPSAPTYPANKIPICELYNVTGETALYDNANQLVGQGYILNDVRPFLSYPLPLAAVPDSIIPATDATYNLGSPSFEWNNLYVKSGIFLNGAAINSQILLAATAGESISAQAGVAAGYYQSDGGIGIDVIGSATPTGSSGAYSLSISVGAGHLNTMLLVLIRYRANTGIITSVPQWNGSNMTNISLADGSLGAGHIYGAYITSPTTGTHNLTFNTGNGSDVACVYYASLYNVNTASPIDNIVSFGSNTGTPSVTMTPNSIGAFLIAYTGSVSGNTGAALSWENVQSVSGTGAGMLVADANKTFPLNPFTVGYGSSGGVTGLISVAPNATAVLPAVVNASASNTASTYADNFSGYRNSAFLGFAVASTSAGSTMNVIVSGIVASLSGLTAGVQYFLSNTGGMIATTAGTITRKVGIAVSTTQLLITNLW